ncbi:hypothetical protein BH09BAC3_BH09BAC3_23630 [soil metagenome]
MAPMLKLRPKHMKGDLQVRFRENAGVKLPLRDSTVCKATGQIATMGLIYKLSMLTLGTLVVGCAIMPPRRQYIANVKRQTVPNELLKGEWALETFDDKAPDCDVTIRFLDKGQFTFNFKDDLYAGDNLWYLVKDSVIEFHTRPLEKLAWTEDNCEMNPSVFALYLMGDKKVTVIKDKMSFDAFDKKRFVFRKKV